MTATKTPVHTLYRFFDASGVLLYVGRTIDARSRFRSHERSKDWFHEVARIDRHVVNSAEELAAAEVAAIRSEGPRYNIQHSARSEVAVTPRPSVAIDGEEDERVFKRIGAIASLWGEDPEIEPCDDGAYEAGCRCIQCVRTVLSILDGDFDAHEDDAPLLARLAELEAEYLAGAEVIDWLYDLGDVVIFRQFALIDRSKTVAAPAFASADDDGMLAIGCPFCQGVHAHYPVAPGSAVVPLEAPCLGGGRYVPSFDYVEFSVASERWHKAVAS